MNHLLQLAHNHPFFTIGAAGISAPILIILIGILRNITEFVAKFLFNSIFLCKYLNDDYTVGLVTRYLDTHAKAFRINDESFDARRMHVRTVEGERVVFFRQSSRSFSMYLYKGVPIIISPKSFINNEEGGYTLNKEASVRFLKKTVNWEDLLAKASDYSEEKRNQWTTDSRFRVIRHVGTRRNAFSNKSENEPPSASTNGISPNDISDHPINYKLDELGNPKPENPIGYLSMTPEMNEVLKNCKFWYKHRQWYKERDISWRKGYGLYGAPGSGKTSLIRAIAEELDLPVHTFDLPSMDNQDFLDAWNKSQHDSPRIVLLEDIDNVFHGRKNIITGSKLSFDTLLNAIDGIERENGLLLFVTTNTIENIDPALGAPDATGVSSRPGRIDSIIQLSKLDHAGRVKIGMRIVRNQMDAEKLALEGKDETPAVFTERCIAFALKQLWSND